MNALIFAIVLAAAAAKPGDAAPAPATPDRASLPEPGVQLMLADVDGDGSEDPVVVYGGRSGCRMARVERAGENVALRTLDGLADAPLRAPLLGDADGDGTADLLAASEREISFRKGLGKGAFDESSRTLYEAEDMLVADDGCAPFPPYLLDLEGDPRPELVLPIAGGVRVVSLEGNPPSGGAARDLLGQPMVEGGESGLRFISALPVLVGSGSRRIIVLGPVLEHGAPRLELSWWSRQEDGSLAGHRTALALPPGESAVTAVPFDGDGDGRPEIAILTAPSRLKDFLGEFGLRVYHTSDMADTPVAPFYSGKTNINYWQTPALAFRAAPGGSDVMLAFYRGLIKSHLNVEIFRADGNGSYEPKPRELGLSSDKEADRSLLIWGDVDGDGTIDLATLEGTGIHVYRGTADREHPLAGEPRWTSPYAPSSVESSVSIGRGGGWSLALGHPGTFRFHDLDGDGLAEMIAIDAPKKTGAKVAGGSDTVTIQRLQPVTP